MNGENVRLLGDMNVSIGNDTWGVKDDHSDVSTGGNIPEGWKAHPCEQH